MAKNFFLFNMMRPKKMDNADEAELVSIIGKLEAVRIAACHDNVVVIILACLLHEPWYLFYLGELCFPGVLQSGNSVKRGCSF